MRHTMHHVVTLVSAAVLAVGIAAAGKFASDSPTIGSSGGVPLDPDRYVTVVGTASRAVTADLVVWPIRLTATGEDLGAAQTTLDQSVDSLSVFLVGEGIPQDDIDPGRPVAIDLLAQAERPEGVEDVRFLLTQTVVVRSAKVAEIATATARIGELAKLGVDLSEAGGPRYRLSDPASVKPDLLAEAVAAARRDAERMVSGESVAIGPLRRAVEGDLVAGPRDGVEIDAPEAAKEKALSLSVTVEFYLQ